MALKAFLDSEVQDIILIEIEDDRGYSLLHIASFKRFSSDFESILCSHIKKQGANAEQLTTYINKQTNNEDGYTALHLAAYHGNFIGIKQLINLGGDP